MKKIRNQMLAMLCAGMLTLFNVGWFALAEETVPETQPQEIVTDEASALDWDQQQTPAEEAAPAEIPAAAEESEQNEEAALDGEGEEQAAPGGAQELEQDGESEEQAAPGETQELEQDEELTQDGENEDQPTPAENQELEQAEEPAKEEEASEDDEPEIDPAVAAYFSPAFQSGYAMILDETAVYREEMPSDQLLTVLNAGMTVYVRGRMNAGANFDQLSIVFHTSQGLQFGFISAKNARPFSHQDAFAFSASLINDGEAGEYNGHLLKKLNCQLIPLAAEIVDETEQAETVPENGSSDLTAENTLEENIPEELIPDENLETAASSEGPAEEEQDEAQENQPVNAGTEDQTAEDAHQEAEAPAAQDQDEPVETIRQEPAKPAETYQQNKEQASAVAPSTEPSPVIQEGAAAYPATLSEKANEILLERINPDGERTSRAFILGDADQDNVITKADGIALLNAIVGLSPMTEQMKLHCDADGNGTIDIFDAIYVMSAAAGLEDIETSDELFTVKVCGEGQIEVTGYLGEQTDLVIPETVGSNTVVRIADEAFKGGQYTSVKIPASVTEIGKMAFENCTSLKSVVLSDNVTIIGAAAFKNCTSLSSMTIEN